MNLRPRHLTPPIVQHLRDIPLFAGCTTQELRGIAGLTTEVRLRAGTILCRQGEPGREAFIILEGEATVDADGTELARLGPGAVCGEIALLDGGTRTATATAVTPIRALAISVPEFAELMYLPKVSRTVLAMLAARLRQADRNVVST